MARSARTTPSHQPTPKESTKQDAQRLLLGDSPIPVRTLIFIEVGDLPTKDVQSAIAQLSELHAISRHPTFICPVRHGRLTTDVIFEAEILDFVDKICEVVDDKIVLKGGATNVDVARLKA